MPTKYPSGMTFTQWRRTPFRTRHWLLGLMINNHFRYWKSCADARCRRARGCQDYQCYWRRLEKMPIEDAQRVRRAAGQALMDRLHHGVRRPVAVLTALLLLPGAKRSGCVAAKHKILLKINAFGAIT